MACRMKVVGGSVVLALLVAAMPACSGAKRAPHDEAELLRYRDRMIEEQTATTRLQFEAILGRVREEQIAHAEGRLSTAPAIDVLIISGGGDWGAFGAGVLKGWRSVPTTDELARPAFDIVTGVSTGALIAPFAYLGNEEATERIVNLYRHPEKDWVRARGILYFLPNNISFAEVPGLERELKTNLSIEMVRAIAETRPERRMLVVNTTNLDDAGQRAFDLVGEADRAVATGDLSRFHNIMLASAGIPGAFPYREIDGAMYVDGGVTSNIIYGGRLGEAETLPAVWQKMYPDAPIPKTRYWVIFNNKLQVQPMIVEPRWPAIITRSIELSTRSATVTALRHLYAMAEISELKRGAEVEVRLISVPNDWTPPVPGVFIAETMNDLADMGERMGADPGSWRTTSP